MDQLPNISLDKLPLEFTFPGLPDVKIRAEQCDKSYWTKISHLWEEFSSEGGGFLHEDVSHWREMVWENKLGCANIVYVNASNGEVVAAMGILPISLCRSEKPIYCGGYVLVDKPYRGKQVALAVMILNQGLATSLGYQGSLSRAAIVAKSLSPAMNAGSKFLGFIPWSAKLEGQGWFPDIICHGQFSNFDAEVKDQPTLQALGFKRRIETSVPAFTRKPIPITLPMVPHESLGNLKVTTADQMDVWDAQHVMRACAMEGDGFGVDEFTSDGVYNEKLIKECRYWVVRREKGEQVVAFVLAGNSGHCRSLGNKQANGVIIVLKPYRKQGVGRMLLEFCESHCKTMGYKYILTDVLATNLAGLALMRTQDFFVTGTVPHTCFVKGPDCNVNAYLHWKPLSPGQPTSRL